MFLNSLCSWVVNIISDTSVVPIKNIALLSNLSSIHRTLLITYYQQLGEKKSQYRLFTRTTRNG